MSRPSLNLLLFGVLGLAVATQADADSSYAATAINPADLPHMTLTQAKVISANYPYQDTSERDYTDRVQSCTAAAQGSAKPSTTTATPNAPGSPPGMASALNSLMARSVAVGNSPEAAACMEQADKDRKAQQARFFDLMAPEALALRGAIARVESCIRNSLKARGVIVKGSCDGPPSSNGDGPALTVVPNHGTLYGGATHLVLLVYTPGDEKGLSPQ